MNMMVLGWEFVAIMGAGIFLGWLADYFFLSSPLFLIVFFVLSAIGSFIKIFSMLRRWLEGSENGE